MPRWTDLGKLPYLRGCLKEALPLNDLVGNLARCSPGEDIQFHQWVTPKKVCSIIPVTILWASRVKSSDAKIQDSILQGSSLGRKLFDSRGIHQAIGTASSRSEEPASTQRRITLGVVTASSPRSPREEERETFDMTNEARFQLKVN